MERQEVQKTIEDLPTEILLHMLSFLRIPDLVQIQKVSKRFLRLVSGTNEDSCNPVWAKASTEGVSVNKKSIKFLERGARFGNKEALIKLAVAYLYSEGVPDGTGKGTELAENGIKAAEYIIKLESLPNIDEPFSWLLIRPPFSRNFVCCKACVCNRVKQACSGKNCSSSLFYIIGKAFSFHEEAAERDSAVQWFQTGSEQGSLACCYEYWKSVDKCQVSLADVTPIRLLRQVASDGQIMDAKFELCKQYGAGHYGGLSRSLAMSYVKQVMSTAPPLLSDKIFKAQHKINKYMILVLIDWIIEVSEMKLFSTKTVHLAIQLIQRYLLQRCLSRSRVQLLGITSLLVAARWTDHTILTIREAASITDDTYTYQDVVNMMADLMATLKGKLVCPLPTDYMEILYSVSSCDERTIHLTSFIAECSIVHSEFGGLSTACFSAACFLLSRVLLAQEFPWPSNLVEATGMDVSDLKDTVILLYNKCFIDDTVIDYRGEKLNAIHSRYAEDRYHGVSEMKIMSLPELKDCLGTSPSPLSPPGLSSSEPSSELNQKLFSFLSDGQYRSDDDSIVDQSFIQEFNSHFISQPLVQQSSPLSCFSIPLPFSSENSVSPISSVGVASSVCDSSSKANSSGCLSTSGGENSSISMAAPLSGIEPLFSEETSIEYDTRVKKKSLKKSRHSSNKENIVSTNHPTKKIYKPLPKREEQNCFEKRTKFDSSSNISNCKRRRSS